MAKTHTFDWHKEPEGSFLKWVMLHFGSDTRKGDSLFEQMSEATDHFQNIELKIMVSGVEVDAKKFMDRLDEGMDWAVKREAKKIIEEMPRLHELHETLHDFEQELKRRVISIANEAGIGLEGEEWDL
jgi:predicted  nucleic acid-binding Zn-ribbon protein